MYVCGGDCYDDDDYNILTLSLLLSPLLPLPLPLQV